MKNKLTGIVAAVVGASAYGLNPLFALPLYGRGFQVFQVLGYSALIAALILGISLKFRKEKLLPENCREFAALTISGIAMFGCAFTLFQSYRMIGSGLASTVFFIYPVIVAISMALFFHEKLTVPVVAGAVTAVAGVAVLSGVGGQILWDLRGFLLALVSALFYSFYLLMLRESSLKNVSAERISFYTVFSNALLFLVICVVMKDFKMPCSWFEAGCFAGLVFFPSIAALILMAAAVRRIGASKTAVFGGFEPLTAVSCGIVFFGEKFTINIAVGIILVISSALITIYGDYRKNSSAGNIVKK